MTWTRIAVLAATIALGVAACADRVSSPQAGDAERAQLVARAEALRDRVTAAGHMSDEDRRELEDIMDDIEGWQERTGRKDLSFSRARQRRAPAAAALVGKTPTPAPSCVPCAPVEVINGNICFLIEDAGCPPTPAPGDLSLHTCLYGGCIYTSPSPVKSR